MQRIEIEQGQRLYYLGCLGRPLTGSICADASKIRRQALNFLSSRGSHSWGAFPRQRLREPGAITLFAALEFRVPRVSQLASCRLVPTGVHCVLPAPGGCLYFLQSLSLQCPSQQLCLLLCVSDLRLQPCVGFSGFHITVLSTLPRVLSTLPRCDSWNYSGPSWIRQGHLLHLGLGLNTPAKSSLPPCGLHLNCPLTGML